MALVLQQPKGEPEYNMKELQATGKTDGAESGGHGG